MEQKEKSLKLLNTEKSNISIDTKNDEYSKERKKEYGKCSTCNRYNTNHSWCQSCDPQILTQGWTSGNELIDEMIKSSQLKATEYKNEYYLHCIQYKDLKNIEKIDESPFAVIYKAAWINGDKYVDKENKRCCKDRIVALKKAHNSQNIYEEFLNEFKNYVKFDQNHSIIRIYGITQDPGTKQYMFVMRYTEDGNIANFLSKGFKNLKWKDKIGILFDISGGLKRIHEQKIVHRNLHSGNILHDYYAYISDLGSSTPVDRALALNDIFGVLPYIAPEVLNGKHYTMASDVYSFGVLMSVISTGRQPFYNTAHDKELASKICQGTRPAFSINTPGFYIELAYECMDVNPDKRPTTKEIHDTISLWNEAFDKRLTKPDHLHSEFSKKQLDKLKPIKEEFEKMDKIDFDPSTITETAHPYAIYTGRVFDFTGLPHPINSNKITIIGNHNDSHQTDLKIKHK